MRLTNGRRLFRVDLRALCLTCLCLLAPGVAVALEAVHNACQAGGVIRFATFNVFLNRPTLGELGRDLAAGDPQARAVARIIQAVRPDVLLLNEFDFDASGEALQRFVQSYLEQPQDGGTPIAFPYRFLAPSNTGIAAQIDVDGDGTISLPADAYGYGKFPGQYAMALLSRYPIQEDRVRTFQRFLWRDMPGALLPDDPSTPQPGDFYSATELEAFRLSSKSHWDVPVMIGAQPVHVLAAHPTPAIFDGPEDHNGRRNHDEIRLWADYINARGYLYDDNKLAGGLAHPSRFVIMGDYNADPQDGDSFPGAIAQLLADPLVNAERVPLSRGGVIAAALDRDTPPHTGDPAADTSDFSQNLRIDYVLPSHWGLSIVQGGVFWPRPDDPLYALVGDGDPVVSSDHRLVWQDFRLTDCAPGVQSAP
ncbi:MAG: endonuclease/exonuclease/phosphatase family protein [Pseudomonadota bacterium]